MISYSDLKTVNAEINLLPYETELVEDWKPSTIAGKGDCDSHATAKQWVLVREMGLPESSTRLACCFVEPFRKADGNWATKGERYHLVLLVDLDNTTYVLDNRHPLPVPYDHLPYEWHRMWSYDLNAWEYAIGADKNYA